MATLKPGDEAPDFTLYNTEKKPVSLHDYKGKNVVLLFFPLAFSGTCTKELCSMRDSLHDFTGLNAEVLAISIDSVFVLAKFKEIEKLNFELLSDFNREVSQAYGALYSEFILEMRGVAKRSAFVVDKDGIIRYAEVLEKSSDLPDMEAIQTALKELK